MPPKRNHVTSPKEAPTGFSFPTKKYAGCTGLGFPPLRNLTLPFLPGLLPPSSSSSFCPPASSHSGLQQTTLGVFYFVPLCPEGLPHLVYLSGSLLSHLVRPDWNTAPPPTLFSLPSPCHCVPESLIHGRSRSRAQTGARRTEGVCASLPSPTRVGRGAGAKVESADSMWVRILALPLLPGHPWARVRASLSPRRLV